MPTANKIELFARNNNLRQGWLSMGNQLGENYMTCKNIVYCHDCQKHIEVGMKRFKSKVNPNKDVCENCMDIKSNKYVVSDFFQLENCTDEDILHEYLKCNNCHIEPIYGPRFKCKTCPDVDMCETCFDERMLNVNLKSNAKTKSKKEKKPDGKAVNELVKSKKISCEDHDFDCIELPLLANGLAAHNDYKCVYCYMRPIIGACFICADCPHFSICQNCYFTRSHDSDKMKIRGHNPQTHHIELIVEPRQHIRKYVKCQGC